MAAAGRKQTQAAAAVVVALVAMLLVAGAAAQGDCGISGNTLSACQSYCSNGGNKDACCTPIRRADKGCLCNYWRKYNSVPSIKRCADKINSDCGIHMSC